MKEYHKIQTVFKRDPETKFKKLLMGVWSLPEFEYLQHLDWTFTEKVDGTNIRVMFDGSAVRLGGKTDNASIPAFLIEKLNGMFCKEEKIIKMKEVFNCDEQSEICLYGEGYGAKIQKGGGNYRSDQDFVLFDVKIGDWWLQRKDVFDIAKKLDITAVPVIGHGTLHDMVKKAREGFSSAWGEFPAEGIVARPVIELKDRSGHRIITKIKTKDFQENGK